MWSVGTQLNDPKCTNDTNTPKETWFSPAGKTMRKLFRINVVTNNYSGDVITLFTGIMPGEKSLVTELSRS